MKNALATWNKLSLIIRILIGLIIGVILGVACPGFTVVAIFGDVFVGALKAIAPVLVFVLVMSSLANAKGGVGKRFSRVIGLYMFCSKNSAIGSAETNSLISLFFGVSFF